MKNILDGAIVFIISVFILFSNEVYYLKLFGILAIAIIIYINQRRKSEIRQKENELKINTERYIMAIEAMDGAVWEWDEKSEKIYISVLCQKVP